MKPLQQLHTGLVHPRRVRVLAALIAPWLPQGGKVLDVGCGDGALSAAIAEMRPDLRLSGIDVLVRPAARFESRSSTARRFRTATRVSMQPC